MKKISIIGIIIILLGIIVITNRQEIYNGLKQIANKITKKNSTSTKKEKNVNYVWGIDISHHQNKIDWDKLVEYNKPDFIFLKCTEGTTHQDGKYAIYKREATENNILVGAYHFFSYQTSGKDQANNFIKYAELKKGNLYPVLDIEYKKKRPSSREIRKHVKDFCEIIKNEYGVNPIIYCEYDYYNNILKSDFQNFNYWISDLSREPRCNYVFWQYTDKGYVEGIGKIDNNRLNRKMQLSNFILKNR